MEYTRKPIRYIGKRKIHKDGLFGTEITWEQGQVQMVPADKAVLMLKHKDVYEPGDVESAETQEIPEVNEEKDIQEEEENVRESIKQMSRKAQLVDFAKVNFNIELDSKAKVAELQEHCIRLVDQFGLPG